MLPVYSNAEILKSLEQVSLSKNVRLTPTYKAFYIALYSFFDEHASFDKGMDMYCIQFSCRELANLLQFSYKMVCVSLQALNDCGAVVRVDSPKTFKRLPNREYATNKPKFTYLNLELLQCFI